jgi:hypothetical protein
MCAGLGCPYCCLQRHAGARVVARDQSLLRVLALTMRRAFYQWRSKKASVTNILESSQTTLSGLYSRENQLRDTLRISTRHRRLPRAALPGS